MVLAGCAFTEVGKIGSSDFVRYFWGLLGILYQQKEKLQDIQLRGVYSFSSHAPKWDFFLLFI